MKSTSGTFFYFSAKTATFYREMETLDMESSENFHDAVTDNVVLTDSAIAWIGKYFIHLS